MKIRNVTLETVCGITSAIPQKERIEVAFAGKSNVGKSSLINCLVSRKALARTSGQPGKTQTINYYHVNEGTAAEDTAGEEPFAPDCYLVDLPGYGYANASVEIKAKWGRMIENYLRTSKQLRTVFLLVDIRHAPSANDKMMYDWIVDNGMMPVIIATKKDKLKRSQIPKAVKTIREGLGLKGQAQVIPFSAETREGREEVWRLILELAYASHIASEKIQAT
ncbi:MAG: ribosome biogenesis GTP-binding protein YihA/YsxC [Lachnospiraceae bacterium]|nr:ribosome biogenesis GTP-binding protein YihA/YsxC [Lachnospiraceae bacterium]